VSLTEQIAGARSGNVRDIARLLSVVENDAAVAQALAEELLGMPSASPVIGITGPPGVGKSTTTSALVQHYREAGHKVAVLAVDPSSPFSGGALLGDRVRMQAHATDPGVFIRSMAARGHLGGLSAATPLAIQVLESAGFDIIILETVGVGQSEIDVARMADSTVVLLAPGMGDGIQAAKAGIIEIADVFAVNKADRDGADATIRELRAVIALGTWRGWEPPVIPMQAISGVGIADLAAALAAHREWLVASGEGEVRRRGRIRDHIRSLVVAQMLTGMEGLEQQVDAVMAGRSTAYRSAADILNAFRTTS
jgi:LAO/AO transport system kinase